MEFANEIVAEQRTANPGFPASGKSTFYAKSDGNWYMINSDGAVYELIRKNGSGEVALSMNNKITWGPETYISGDGGNGVDDFWNLVVNSINVMSVGGVAGNISFAAQVLASNILSTAEQVARIRTAITLNVF